MAKPFRIASFNIENLFSRARVLNLQDHIRAEQILKQIAELKSLLAKTNYTAAVKAQIKTLLTDLKLYILIREDRGKLMTQAGNITAKGSGDWDGVIEFKRADISELARESTADVMKAVKADVACVIEAENRLTLRQFNSQAMGSKRFACTLVIDGNDERGIDVGVYSNLDIGRIDTHIFDKDSTGVVFSRDCLEVELLSLPNGKPLYILCNHLKSQGYGVQGANDAKRLRQTKRIVEILKKYDLTKDHVAVAGDMNDAPTSGPMAPLINHPNLFDALALQFPNVADRWTYRYQSKNQQLDYLLVSKPLESKFKAAGVERRGIFDIKKLTGENGFPSVTQKKNAASDHGAVWAEFTF